MNHLIKWIFVLSSLNLLGIGCTDPTTTETTDHTPTVVEKKDSVADITIDLTKLDPVFTKDTLTVTIENDRIFEKTKRYLAFPLQPILEKALAENNLDTFATELIYTCTDGYQPSNRLQEVMSQGTGYLAFRDLDAPGGQMWLGENSKKYPPFFLVWKDLPEGENPLAWPYGLFSLTLKPSDAVFSSIFPQENAALQPAFELYKKNCIKCHSLNKIGGLMGPEFNHPTNITTYWTRQNIIAFAKNPQSFRYNSKMPPITNLTDDELNLIVDYLEYLAEDSGD